MTNKKNAGSIGSLNTKYISKERSIESEVQLLHEYDKKPILDLDFLYPRTLYYRNKGRSKRKLASKEMNVKEFEIFKNVQDHQKYSTSDMKYYNTKLSNIPSTENKKLKKVYGYDRSTFLTNDKLLERNNNLARNNITESSNDDIEFLGTAEIEAVLNEVKHREIQMMTLNEPSVSDLISSTVTETTFSSNVFLRKPKLFTDFSFSTFLPFENNNNISEYIFEANTADNDKIQHNINVRSIKEDSFTLANNIENVLQKKCKHKEINKTKVTVENELDKLRDKTPGVTNSTQINATSNLPETNSILKSSLREKHHSKRNRTQKNSISTTLSSHSIPIIGDDYSMLSVFELLLTKSHENNVMNMLYTKSLPAKRKINPEENTIFDDLNNRYNVTDNSSYKAISDKIAYNDYVNGYKYYLNYQKNYDDKKYSNLVRYQAHKHHKVDDIGKFILNKIPHLPTARLKRKFVESETLDDQEISTKSEDSWFKKHFFIFLDKDPPRKFHTSQTVAFKESKLLVSAAGIDHCKQENFTTSKINSFSQQRIPKDILLNDFDLDSKHITSDKLLQADNKPEHTYSPPEQYFNTPIPMQVDEFDKFLKKHDIDVASVMAPLSIPVPQSIQRKKYDKRALQDSPTFTAKDVAALEVVVDLLKSTQGMEDKETTILESNRNKNMTFTPLLEKNNQLNSIQVHIAIPSAIHDKRRSLESVNVRKVFTAIMSTPVDLEYQIHSFDETTNTPTTVQQSILSPGLYLLVENTNITYPKSNFALKPMNMLETSNLKIRHVTVSTVSKKSEPASDTKIISSSNKVVQNLTSNNEIICKRNVHKTKERDRTTNIVRNKKRNVNFDGVKRFFGHERVCHCHCKANRTMCRTCAESDKVISELMFEFDNLEKYVIDHCTEIQTFFWMNPTDGKKLRNVIHRIDKVLNDYYKRVKGKCQGRTCQMISSNIDKRSFNVDETDSLLAKEKSVLLDSLQNISKHTHKKNNSLPVRKYLNTLNNYLTKEIYKRSYLNDDKVPMKSIYSLNNIKINLICDTDTSKITPYSLKNNVNETNTFPTLCDINDVKDKNKKGFINFLKMWSKRKKGKTTSFYYDMYKSKNSKTLKFNNKKRLATENKINLYSSLNCVHDSNNNKHEGNLNSEHEYSIKTNYAKRNIMSSKKGNILSITQQLTSEGDSNEKKYRSNKTSTTTMKKRFSDVDNDKKIYNKSDLSNTLQNINKLLNSLSFNNKGKRNKFVKTTTSYNISNSILPKQIKNNKKCLMNEVKHELNKFNDDTTKSTSTAAKKLLQKTITLRTKNLIKNNNPNIKVSITR
ncbi:uncharacterized protein LOC123654741 [Melitaea cinxia]|uniref:uncharacterized protein LOC123654741 n=1 Tax=Melitaea cinxia TaxID=113334 RepID=UPI001E271724|nr:uncharacterized protein LOC123654741 [Melitaea cinxia]